MYNIIQRSECIHARLCTYLLQRKHTQTKNKYTNICLKNVCLFVLLLKEVISHTRNLPDYDPGYLQDQAVPYNQVKSSQENLLYDL